MEITLKGKRALVTGANSGIGRAIALALGAAGARVAINFVTAPEQADEVVVAIKASGSDAVAIKADVSDGPQVAAMFTQLDTSFGGIDILVNNAGIDGGAALAWDADPVKWRRVLDINLVGAFLCAREALRRMTAQKSGVVLGVSSVHELIPWTGFSAYTASKAGMSMMIKTLAQEGAPFGVRALALGPGAIKTPINANVWNDPALYADLLDKIPLRRMGTPEEIAGIAVFLVSDAAAYITGTTIFADGGMLDYPGFSHGG